MNELDPITSADINEVLAERQTIKEQLEFEKERFAKKIVKIDLNQPATLTKDEQKALKRIKRIQRWNKIKSIFLGEKEEDVWYQDLTN